MAKQVTIRRGTTAEHADFAGAEGEITVDTTKDTVVVHDGVTDGGFPLALESSALSDAEIKTAYENNADTNEFSDAEQSKLSGIETSATADQSDAEIKIAYENNADTNEFSDAEQSKLSSIGTIATQDADAVAITGGSVTGITDLTVADGGTGASDASTARSNLGSTSVGDAVFVATDEEVARAAILVPNKNVIINGNFDIWQRGTIGFGHNVYSADRWVEITNTDDTLSISRQTFTTGQTDVPNEPEFFLRAALTAGSSGSVNDLRQRVEGVRTFAGETVTLSYYAKASTDFTQSNRFIVQNFGTGGTPSNALFHALPDIDVKTFWQKFTTTIALTSLNGKILGTGGNDFVDVILSLAVNTTVDVDIAQVQLEKGSVATEFERRSQQQELSMAQRYYRQTDNRILSQGFAISGTQIRWLNNWIDNPMRGTPTIGTPATVNARQLDISNTSVSSTTGITTESFGKKGGSLIQSGYTGMTAGTPYGMQNSIVTYDAEL